MKKHLKARRNVQLNLPHHLPMDGVVMPVGTTPPKTSASLSSQPTAPSAGNPTSPSFLAPVA
ncbi:hypothetical protein FRB90_009904, partial [Tulasnella sp. 427]